MESKTAIRKAMRAKRNNLDKQYLDLAALLCYKIILKYNLLDNSNKIAFYFANDHELDLKYLLEHCLNQNKQCYLPVLSTNDTHNNTLKFVKYTQNSVLVLNKYNIPEPVYTNADVIPAQELDLVFMPLVAFTKKGQRLGMGGGYYDRTFAFLVNSLNNVNNINIDKPKLIGIGYDIQCIENLKTEKWDIGLHGVATESEFLLFK